jgi:hypothetical protein
MSIQLTREELYELVWERPVSKVAVEFAISDVALHKICRKHNVPVPPRGHWAKLAAGKPVRRKPLPKGPKDQPEFIEIAGSRANQLPQSVLDAQTRGVEQEVSADTVAPTTDPSAIPEILALRDKLAKAKPKKDGFVRLTGKKQFAVCVTPNTEERTVIAIERLAAEALARGCQLTSSDQGLALDIEGEVITLSTEEETERVPHVPTATESANLERWEATYQRKIRRGEWASTWDKPQIPEFDEVPSGKLRVEIDREHCWDGLRRRFRDGKRQRIEDLAPKIVTAAAACAAAAVERRLEAERREREREEYQRRYEEMERQRILEEKRWEFLESKVQLLEKANYLDRFVSDYTSCFRDQVLPEACQKILAWASEQAGQIRAEIEPAKLARVLEKHDLMNDQAKIDSWTRVDR